MRFFTLDLVASSSYAITSSQHWPHLTEEEAEVQGEGASRALWGTPSSIPAPLAPRGRSPEQSIELNVPVLPQRLAARLCGAGLGLGHMAQRAACQLLGPECDGARPGVDPRPRDQVRVS